MLTTATPRIGSGARTHAIYNKDDCIEVLNAAIEALYPSLDVNDHVLRLIAEYVPYGKATHERLSTY